MILECIRVTTDWYADPDNGVNAVLATLPIDSVDSRPPEIGAIRDSTREPDAALGKLGRESVELLLDMQITPARLDPEVATVLRDGRIPMSVVYGTRKRDIAEAKQDGLYTMRAIIACQRNLMLNAQESTRERNSIQIYAMEDLLWERQEIALDEGGLITGLVSWTYICRDIAP